MQYGFKMSSACISVAILASKMQNQNIVEAHAGTHMNLYERRNKEKENNQLLLFLRKSCILNRKTNQMKIHTKT